MRHGKLQHISQLQIGDVVRLTHGDIVSALKRDSEADDIAQRLNGGLKQVVGGPRDFREGYDAMTVVSIEGNDITFKRPYIHVMERISSVEVTCETFNSYRDHGGLWYELLSCGPDRKDKTHWENENWSDQ